ncbi:MAG: hypothetical protein IT350_14475 [Deltaproteobacteria bacterium]|nr:hypothetical protein [Deltaproteobacteria bacterium]
MRVMFGIVAALIWLCPLISAADWSEGPGGWDDIDDGSSADNDADDANDADRAFCEALTNLAEYCGTTCLPEDFFDACVEAPPRSMEPCLSFTGCADFDECVCGSDPSGEGNASNDGDDSDCAVCGVSNAETGSFLSAGMLGIGVLALVLSRREGKSS